MDAFNNKDLQSNKKGEFLSLQNNNADSYRNNPDKGKTESITWTIQAYKILLSNNFKLALLFLRNKLKFSI